MCDRSRFPAIISRSSPDLARTWPTRLAGLATVTYCLEGRFTLGGQLLQCCSGAVSSSSWYRSMSTVPGRFWHVAGMVRPPTYADSCVIVCRDYRDVALDAERVVEAAS